MFRLIESHSKFHEWKSKINKINWKFGERTKYRKRLFSSATSFFLSIAYSTAMLILKYRIKINFKQKKNKEHSIHTDRFSIQNLLFKMWCAIHQKGKRKKMNSLHYVSIQIDAIASSPTTIYQNITRRGGRKMDVSRGSRSIRSQITEINEIEQETGVEY